MRQVVRLLGGYSIEQDDAYFKLSQDSVLLSAFARLPGKTRALDLGAGCGALALLALIRNPEARVDGVELQPGAAALANENYARCGFAPRGHVQAGDLRALPEEMVGQYTVCLSNPPYYAPGRGKQAQEQTLALARCDSQGTIFDVCRAASRALQWGGLFYVCYKPERLSELMQALVQNGLEAKSVRFVHHDRTKPASLVMAEAKKGGGAGLKVAPPLYICGADGQKSDEYKRIYQIPMET